MTSRHRFFTTLGLCLSIPGVTVAQSQPASVPAPAPIVVEVTPGAVPGTPEAVRDAVSRELHAPTLAPDSPQSQYARGTLTIAVDPQHRLIVTYRDASGRQIFRTVTVPSDPVAVVGTIALLAGNLARDESGELLAQLQGGAPAQPEPIAAQETPVEPAPAPPAAPPPPPPPPPPPAPEPAPEPAPVPLAAPAPTPAREVEPTLPDEPLGAHQHGHIALEGYFGTVPRAQTGSHGTQLEPTFTGGLSLSLSLFSHLAVGVNHLNVTGASMATGTRMAFSIAPFLEASTFFGRRLQLYGQGGPVVQNRTGGGIPDTMGVAVYAGAGARFWVTRNFSAGLGSRAYYVATDEFEVGNAFLPRGAILITGGLDLAAHF